MRTVSLRYVSIALAVMVVLAGAVWFARRIPVLPPPAPDYDLASSWICRPGRNDACAKPTAATIFAPGAGPRVETFSSDPAAPIDCFYVYPTVSRVRAAYSPIEATDEEVGVVRNQLARFGSACRLFAPLYRQVTRSGLPLLFGGRRGVTIDVPYADVVAAWKSYLAKDNSGRGVVLIGHSQGARLLARLIAEEIDAKPAAKQLVSAIIPGTRVDVPEGKMVGGLYRQTPLCTSAKQTACVIAYSSYLADRKLPAEPRFGVSETAGMRAACVDPMSLDGAKSLDADFPMTSEQKHKYDTDFAEVPGLLAAACRTDGRASFLAVDAKPQDQTGEAAKAKIEGLVDANPAFGLHELDINLALGTLIDIVRKQTETYLRR